MTTFRYKDGGPAFPRPASITPDGGILDDSCDGMSLRDWFAGMAMQGILSSHILGAVSIPGEVKAGMAYAMADALLNYRVE